MNLWVTDTTSKRRDKLSIITEILEIAKDGTLKTQIMYRANLSFVQLTEYLDYLLKTNLLNKLDINAKDVYATTEKGLEFIQKHTELTALLNDENEDAKNGVKIPPQNLLRKP